MPPKELENIHIGGPFSSWVELKVRGAGLEITITGPDSVKHTQGRKNVIFQPYPFEGMVAYPKTLQEWLRWVREKVAEALLHEMDEWLVLRLADPHSSGGTTFEPDVRLVEVILAKQEKNWEAVNEAREKHEGIYPDDTAFCERCGQDLADHKVGTLICDTCVGERKRRMWSKMDLERWDDG